MARLKITQIKSRIGATKRQCANLDALGLKKINASVEKTTLGDIAGLAALKSAMEAEAKKGKKAAKDEE